jgi:hypothetical protein
MYMLKNTNTGELTGKVQRPSEGRQTKQTSEAANSDTREYLWKDRAKPKALS